jgi:hypothetical protein
VKAREASPAQLQLRGEHTDPDDEIANHEALLRLAEAVRVYAASDDGGEVV